jgi:hypothetical protein
MTTFRGAVTTLRRTVVPPGARPSGVRAGHNGGVDARNALADLVAAADERAPGLIRFLAGLRWGGLRTVRPGRSAWVAVAASGTVAGLGARAAVERTVARLGSMDTPATRARRRVPAAVAAVAGQVVVWLTLWRWDTFRWRRTRVALVVDLPAPGLVLLVEELRGSGLDVQRWERRDRTGGPVRGVVCRSRDLRTVNRAVDAALHGPVVDPDDREVVATARG